jgi:glutaminyl-tRNA synthetase
VRSAPVRPPVPLAEPGKGRRQRSFLDNINPDSLQVLTGCRAEPSLGQAQPEDRFQFEREGYFCADLKDSSRSAGVQPYRDPA